MVQLRHPQRQAEIKPGDIVRLLQPFKPERSGFREYNFAIVAGVVGAGNSSENNSSNLDRTSVEQSLGLNEIVVYLYEPDSSTIYKDQFGVEALFSFASDEVELDAAI